MSIQMFARFLLEQLEKVYGYS